MAYLGPGFVGLVMLSLFVALGVPVIVLSWQVCRLTNELGAHRQDYRDAQEGT